MKGLLSRVSDEFGHIDEPLLSYFNATPSFNFKTPQQINSFASGTSTLDKLWAFIQGTDVVVHLVGN